MMNEFVNPRREFSLAPFWFWNDALDEAEIVRQIADFEVHGVYGFVIHPRVGLPRDIAWMSDRMLHFMRVAVEEAQRRAMFVILYDEGMYPSGSSSGQVVATNPAYQCRCLAKIDLDDTSKNPFHPLNPLTNLVATFERPDGQRIAIVDRPVDAVIRGLHYIGEGPDEDTPPAADILNPDATATFIRLVYDRYAEALGDHFGTTIRAIFTDEPGLLGRPRERNVWPGTTGILEHVNAVLGYDFTPHLPALWYADEPDAARYREDYKRALAHRLEATYYRPLYEWCEAHGIALTGHPGRGDDIGYLRYFHIPGQDIVWRWVLPGPTALEGPESTQGKCSSSAALHLGRWRNSNECFGAYGHGFTWEEMKWLVDWCFVRGVNLLYPHAFFYSIRGPRKDERPPDVGPHSPWWDDYKPFADYARRMSWLNTDSEHVCHIAILTESSNLPWAAAKICFQHQRDFNYLELRHLWENAEVMPEGIFIAGMHYKAAILDGLTAIPAAAEPALQTLADAGRLIAWQSTPLPSVQSVQSVEDFLTTIDHLIPPDLAATPPAPDLRYRHVVKEGAHYYILVNEGLTPLSTTLTISVNGRATWIDPLAMTETTASEPLDLTLEPYTLRILRITNYQLPITNP
ncbi:MAG TPA: glycosyl hydrolase [Anaerolineae bacterium]|nr:glycosyl hydrolase [Anaerolineae bacterium]HQI83864.1 glycosyl hydrolase [Anaerolineae bacterium]